MPSVYNTVFGGNLVAPALPTYLSLNFSTNQTLSWPLESNITAPSAAEIMDCTATAPGLTIQLSDARQISTGYCALFNNTGANTFTVLDAQGNTLMAPASGAAWQIYLADNSTLQGTWRVFQYGASVSVANAAALAGAGLKAISATLNEQIFINAQAVNYTIGTGTNADRAACVEWTGGSGGTFSSSTAPTLGTGWFCYIKNSGTGVLTFTPGSGQVNGTASLSFNPNDSAILATDGTNFFTIGFGQAVASTFNFVTISLAGASGTVVLTGAQLNRVSYKFTGALAGNTVVQVPASIQQYWVDNETTGSFTLTISAGGAGATFVVPQTTRVILYCDGLNIVNAVSAGTGGITLVADGTAAAPGLAWASDTQMGLYKAGTDTLAFSTAGTARGNINSAGQWTVNVPASGTALTVTGLAANAAVAIGASSGAASSFVIGWSDGLSSNFWNLFSQSTDPLVVGTAGAATLALSTNALQRVVVSSAGTVSVNTPTSGSAFSANGATSGSNTPILSQSSDSAYQLSLGYNYGTANAINSSGTSARALQIQIGNTTYATWATTGGLTLAAPSSGTTLAITVLSAANGITIGASSGAAAALSLGWNVGITGSAWNFYSQSTDPFTVGTLGAATFVLATNSATRVSINSSGNVTISSPSSGNTLTVTAVNNGRPAQFAGGATAGQSFGPLITAGTNSSDQAFLVQNDTATTSYFEVRGDGVVFGNDGTSLFELGYKDLPQNSQTVNYTTVLADRGKSLVTGSSIVFTIAANASVAYPVGAVLTFVNLSGGNISIGINTDTLTLAGTSSTGTRTLANNGIATALKVLSTAWLISGPGLT